MSPPLRRLASASKSARGNRPVRPGLEALEGRALLAAVALDPTFGQNGAVLGPVLSNGPSLLDNTASVLSQPDGKLVIVGGDPAGNNPLFVRRYDANGGADTTFGTNGQVSIPLPTYPSGGDVVGTGAVLEADGRIVFTVSTGSAFSANGATLLSGGQSRIFELTTSGQLDSSFGQNGEFTINLPDAQFANIAVQPDGRIVAAGLSTAPNSAATLRNNQISLVRLTPAGALDPTFNGTGVLAAVPGSMRTWSAGVDGLTITALGQIVVTGAGQDLSVAPHLFVARLLGDGALDPAFGSGGSVQLVNSYLALGFQAAFEPDGTIVLPAEQNSPSVGQSAFGLLRLLPSGAIDPTFRPFTPAPASPPRQYDAPSTFAIGPDGAITFAGVDGTQHALLLDRFLPDGAVDRGFGVNGRATLTIPSTITPTKLADGAFSLRGLVINPAGQLIVAGDQYGGHIIALPDGPQQVVDSSQFFLARVATVLGTTTPPQPTAGDYNGDGKSDIAAELEAFGLFAIRPSSGQADVVGSFGPAGLGATIPAPGDYDGDGRTDVAAYLPAYGVLVYRPSSGGADVIVPFGIPGAGQSIPAPGDYDGDGRTDVAVYLPRFGILAYRPSSGGADVLVPFGAPGTGQSIPAPGDYDGDGKTDPAVYLPALGLFAYRPSSGGADVVEQFGLPGAGQTIPAPGDYNGDGRTDVAAYLPSFGLFAYRPSGGGADVLTPFGLPGSGGSIPAPGDYDGDGKTDAAVYLPSLALFAYRPSSGGADVIEQFGAIGPGQTVPASSISAAQPGTATSGGVAAQAVVMPLPLTDDLIHPTTSATRKKKGVTHRG